MCCKQWPGSHSCDDRPEGVLLGCVTCRVNGRPLSRSRCSRVWASRNTWGCPLTLGSVACVIALPVNNCQLTMLSIYIISTRTCVIMGSNAIRSFYHSNTQFSHLVDDDDNAVITKWNRTGKNRNWTMKHNHTKSWFSCEPCNAWQS